MSAEHLETTAIQLFISTDDADCAAVKDYLETWAEQHENVSFEAISILDNPVRVIRLEINHTPALVINGVVVSQQCELEEVKALLKDVSG